MSLNPGLHKSVISYRHMTSAAKTMKSLKKKKIKILIKADIPHRDLLSAVSHKRFCEEMAFTSPLDARRRAANAKQALAFFSHVKVPSDRTELSLCTKTNFCCMTFLAVVVVSVSQILQLYFTSST